jgi:hypothetical protein
MEANPIMMPEHRGSYDQHPAQQAAFEIASIHSASLSEVSGETGHTASGRRGRRKASAPVENTMILNL